MLKTFLPLLVIVFIIIGAFVLDGAQNVETTFAPQFNSLNNALADAADPTR